MESLIRKELENTKKLAYNDINSDKYDEVLADMKELIDTEKTIRDSYATEIEELQSRMQSELEPILKDIEEVENQLFKMYDDELKLNPGARIETSHGIIRTQKQQPKYTRNNSKFSEWLEKNNYSEYVKIEKKPEWGKFKKETRVVGGELVTKDGEIVEGVEVEHRPDVTVIDFKE